MGQANTPIYVPSQITFDTSDTTQLAHWAQNEFQILSRSLTSIQQLQMGLKTVAPPQPRTGLLAYADGTNWNPGFGEGLYEYTSAGLWVPLSGNATASSSGSALFQRLTATTASVVPHGGSAIKVNGAMKSLVGGVGLTTTNCFINGVGGQSVAANTLYYAYVAVIGGVLVVDLSTTGHALDVSAANAGTEIKSGDSSRTLVGMFFTDGSSQLNNSITKRNVASWSNRLPKGLEGLFTANRTLVGPAAPTEYNTEDRIEFVCWNDMSADLYGVCSVFNQVAGDTSWTTIGLSSNNGSTFSQQDGALTVNGTTAITSGGPHNVVSPGEGHFVASIFGLINTVNSVTMVGNAVSSRTSMIGGRIDI